MKIIPLQPGQEPPDEYPLVLMEVYAMAATTETPVTYVQAMWHRGMRVISDMWLDHVVGQAPLDILRAVQIRAEREGIDHIYLLIDPAMAKFYEPTESLPVIGSL